MQLDPSTVWLREEGGSRAFFPDLQNSHFVLSDDVGHLIKDLVAMGSPMQGQPSFAPSAGRVASTSSSLANETSTSGTQPVQAMRKTQSINVKIIQASVKRLANGKLEFMPHNQTFVDVTETTANVNYVTAAVQRKWGSDYNLVTSDGLKVDDSSGTHGKYYEGVSKFTASYLFMFRAQILESRQQKVVCCERVRPERVTETTPCKCHQHPIF